MVSSTAYLIEEEGLFFHIPQYKWPPIQHSVYQARSQFCLPTMCAIQGSIVSVKCIPSRDNAISNDQFKAQIIQLSTLPNTVLRPQSVRFSACKLEKILVGNLRTNMNRLSVLRAITVHLVGCCKSYALVAITALGVL
jgi:hypothetical protein